MISKKFLIAFLGILFLVALPVRAEEIDDAAEKGYNV